MQAHANTLPLTAQVPQGKPKAVKMAAKLAYRNLFHDRLSLIVTLTGIVFSVVLVAVQCGLYIGSERMIAAMLDQSNGDLWVVPLGTKSFDDPSLLIGHEKYSVLSTPGCRRRRGARRRLCRLAQTQGRHHRRAAGRLRPRERHAEAVEHRRTAASAISTRPLAVAVDDTYFADLGVDEERRDRRDQRRARQDRRGHARHPLVHHAALRVHLAEAGAHALDAGANQACYTLVRVAPGADLEQVRADLVARLQDREVLTQREFRNRSVDYWLFQTGAGAALIAGAALGMIVGVVIVAQTLYSSTKDHLNEFATLRALGASAGYIHKVILIQAMLSAVLGYGVGMILSMLVIWASKDTTLLIVMTPGLAVLLFALTIGMCAIAAYRAIFKVTRIDPAGVFSR